MITIWTFILIPLVLYVAAFVVETVLAFTRLKNRKANHSYLPATWETTHTFLVVSVALFVAFFSQNLVELAEAAWWGIWIAAVGIGLRGAVYVYLFYVRANRATRNWIDYTFAALHVWIVAGLGVLLVQLIPAILAADLKANTAFIPYMWPGLVLVLGLCVVPLASLYKTPKR